MFQLPWGLNRYVSKLARLLDQLESGVDWKNEVSPSIQAGQLDRHETLELGMPVENTSLAARLRGIQAVNAISGKVLIIST